MSVNGVDPAMGVQSIRGIRVHDIGQGDSISILDEAGSPFLQIDYGGRVGNPLVTALDIDTQMNVAGAGLLMLTHWDEDHWCSARKGTVAQTLNWLVPRQITSPRAVEFSARLANIHCVPESMVGNAYKFETALGDEIWWEKIAAAPGPAATEENCNHTGIGFSIVRNRPDGRRQVILLPGDAPFDDISHYKTHLAAGIELRGVLAFHHGTNQHWSAASANLLKGWSPTSRSVDVVFSCARNNSYGHPHKLWYQQMPYARKLRTTPGLRRAGLKHFDMVF
ncbi:MAG TPA: hypothetical protein VM240_01065 [Verrucomicrobiae bacterium]|nr:hypothetical protein [Verrucomicrobiae bacterium]